MQLAKLRHLRQLGQLLEDALRNFAKVSELLRNLSGLQFDRVELVDPVANVGHLLEDVDLLGLASGLCLVGELC